MLTNLIVGIICQYIHILKHYIVYLKLIPCYVVNYISIKLYKINKCLRTSGRKPSADLKMEKPDLRSTVCQAFSHTGSPGWRREWGPSSSFIAEVRGD